MFHLSFGIGNDEFEVAISGLIGHSKLSLDHHRRRFDVRSEHLIRFPGRSVAPPMLHRSIVQHSDKLERTPGALDKAGACGRNVASESNAGCPRASASPPMLQLTATNAHDDFKITWPPIAFNK